MLGVLQPQTFSATWSLQFIIATGEMSTIHTMSRLAADEKGKYLTTEMTFLYVLQ